MRGKRHEIIVLGAVPAAGVVLTAAAAAGHVLIWQAAWSYVTIFVIMGVVSLGGPLFIGLRMRHLWSVYRASDGRICPHCGYSLLELGDEGTCPECGKGFERSDVRKQWDVIIDSRAPRKPDAR